MSEFIIVFREVLEASLVVGIIYLILEKSISSNIITNKKDNVDTTRFCNIAIKKGRSNWSIIFPI